MGYRLFGCSLFLLAVLAFAAARNDPTITPSRESALVNDEELQRKGGEIRGNTPPLPAVGEWQYDPLTRDTTGQFKMSPPDRFFPSFTVSFFLRLDEEVPNGFQDILVRGIKGSCGGFRVALKNMEWWIGNTCKDGTPSFGVRASPHQHYIVVITVSDGVARLYLPESHGDNLVGQVEWQPNYGRFPDVTNWRCCNTDHRWKNYLSGLLCHLQVWDYVLEPWQFEDIVWIELQNQMNRQKSGSNYCSTSRDLKATIEDRPSTPPWESGEHRVADFVQHSNVVPSESSKVLQRAQDAAAKDSPSPTVVLDGHNTTAPGVVGVVSSNPNGLKDALELDRIKANARKSITNTRELERQVHLQALRGQDKALAESTRLKLSRGDMVPTQSSFVYHEVVTLVCLMNQQYLSDGDGYGKGVAARGTYPSFAEEWVLINPMEPTDTTHIDVGNPVVLWSSHGGGYLNMNPVRHNLTKLGKDATVFFWVQSGGVVRFAMDSGGQTFLGSKGNGALLTCDAHAPQISSEWLVARVSESSSTSPMRVDPE